MKQIIIILIIVFAIISEINADELDKISERHHEYTSDTLYILDKVFAEKRDEYLELISVPDFIDSKMYFFFKKNLKKLYINFNHRIEICNKDFIVENKKDLLTITFERNIKTDNIWYIKNTFFKQNNIIDKNQLEGFSPLSVVRYFDDLSDIVNNINIEKYILLTKFGNLDLIFFNKGKLAPTKQNDIIIKNIILHDKKVIKYLIYINLKYFPPGNKFAGKHKSGWLVSKGGFVSELYSSSGDIFLDLKLDQIKNNDLELNRPNDLISVNLDSQVDYYTNKNKTNHLSNIESKKRLDYNVIENVKCEDFNTSKSKYLQITFIFEKKTLNTSNIENSFVSKLKNDNLLIKINKSFYLDEHVYYKKNCGLRISKMDQYANVKLPGLAGLNAYRYTYIIYNDSIVVNVFYH